MPLKSVGCTLTSTTNSILPSVSIAHFHVVEKNLTSNLTSFTTYDTDTIFVPDQYVNI